MGAGTATLIDVYTKHVRSAHEFVAVVWSSSINKENPNMDTFAKRKKKLCSKFATKSFTHSINNHWFVQYQEDTITRSERPYSGIPYLTNLLNTKVSSVPL